MAPAADMSDLADAAWNETLTNEQRVTLVYALQSLKWFNPDMNLTIFDPGSPRKTGMSCSIASPPISIRSRACGKR